MDLRNNQIFDGEFLINLPNRSLLDILINSRIQLHTSCITLQRHFNLDISISSMKSMTRLHILEGKFQWILNENDITNFHCFSFMDSRSINIMEKIQKKFSIHETFDIPNVLYEDCVETLLYKQLTVTFVWFSLLIFGTTSKAEWLKMYQMHKEMVNRYWIWYFLSFIFTLIAANQVAEETMKERSNYVDYCEQ